MEGLTEARARALRSFGDLLEVEPSPSLPEWSREDGRAWQTLMRMRDWMVEQGIMQVTPGRRRSLRLTAKGRRVYRSMTR